MRSMLTSASPVGDRFRERNKRTFLFGAPVQWRNIACVGAGGVAYMAKQFKNRPKDMKISVYLIHTRMYAQMTVVGKVG